MLSNDSFVLLLARIWFRVSDGTFVSAALECESKMHGKKWNKANWWGNRPNQSIECVVLARKLIECGKKRKWLIHGAFLLVETKRSRWNGEAERKKERNPSHEGTRRSPTNVRLAATVSGDRPATSMSRQPRWSLDNFNFNSALSS